jgi:acyl-CoA synthetase (AMP-forming)/AMP-acid ligase II
MKRSQIEQLRHGLPGVELYVMFGQTEAAARLTCLPAHMLETKLGSAGKAIPGVDLEVRSADSDTTLPRGETGEIWARGPNVMLGYWSNPEETSQVLRDGWLWTRDRGRLDEDGFLYIEGRSSDMIKTGANRVSPDEIEEVLGLLEGVEQVGVTGIPDEVLGQAVFAAIVPSSGASLSEQTVKAFCLNLLAAYKIPKRVLIVDELPRTVTGKLQRQLLAQLATGVNSSE